MIAALLVGVLLFLKGTSSLAKMVKEPSLSSMPSPQVFFVDLG